MNIDDKGNLVTAASDSDERVRDISAIHALVSRPDFGAIAGLVLVLFLFAMIAGDSGMFAADGILNWATVSAQLAILAVGACLLMISGEFDLSMGSMIGFCGMVIAIPTVYWSWPIWSSLLLTLSVASLIGALIGYIVVRTKLPSFIVSLAFLFILRGLTIALSILFTNKTIVSGVNNGAEDDWLAPLFGGEFGQSIFNWLAQIGVMDTYADGEPIVTGIPMVIIWSIALACISSWVLFFTRFGNWIFATGGDPKAASNMGIPTAKVKVILFMFTAFCAAVYASCQVIEFGSAAADRGVLKEFEAIIAVVIGGTLLTGGYGSVLGALFGALIFGVVQIGLFFSGISSDWFRVFLGIMLLMAVLFNNFIRQRLTR
ncbi:MAG: ABC transporter permease [Paraglaciecola sp.]|uniref:ABC transporter permease n=1 Tax=Paraglaciecola sp. TaxID=1920173 RepID=UPI00329A45B4